MASVEEVRKTLARVCKEIEKESGLALKVSQSSMAKRKSDHKGFSAGGSAGMHSIENRLMNSFHVGDPITNQINIAKYVITETGCSDCVIIRLVENDLFRIYFRGTSPFPFPETYNLEDFGCVQAVIQRKVEVVQTDEDFGALSLLVQWRPLFAHIPDLVLAIPILKVDQQVIAIVALGFRKKLPSDFMINKMPPLRDFLEYCDNWREDNWRPDK